MRPVPWSLGSALTLLIACGVDDPEAVLDRRPLPALDSIPVSVVQSAAPSADSQAARSALGVERVVPLRFHVLDDAQRTCPLQFDMSVINGALREANAIFLSTGVQFTIAGVATHVAPTFRDLTDATTVTWAQVWSELTTIAPSSSPSLFAGRTAPDRYFLHAVATTLSTEEIPLFVPCTLAGAAYASYPWADSSGEFWDDQSRVIVIDRASFGSPTARGRGFKQLTLAHELGHYLGLPHPFDLRGRMDPENGDAADFYDLFYSLRDGTPRPYASRAELEADWNLFPMFPGIATSMKSGGDASGAAQCGASGLDGDLTCIWAGQTFRTSTDPEFLEGMGFAFPDGRYGVNVMDYLTVAAPDGSWNALAALSDTQIARVRETLRSPRGHRDELGRGPGPVAQQRDSFGFAGVELDFSGDGLRDLAYFDWDREACVIRASGTGAVSEISLSQADVTLGDMPIAADMNRDGRTDCVVYRPGTGIGDAQWLYQLAGGNPTLFRAPIPFGSLGDEPFGNVRVRTGSAPATWGVYTPGTGAVWFRSPSGQNWSLGLGAPHASLAFGDYDLDGYTDLAAWHPTGTGLPWPLDLGQAWLTIRRSRENYAVLHTIPFGHRDDVPLGPVVRDTWSPTFALWRPTSGQWFYLTDPGYSDSPAYTVDQWGLDTDVPLPGFDFDNDGVSDPAVYRPASTLGGAGILYVWGTTDGGRGFQIGEAGDVPFLARDHNGDGPPELYLYRPQAGSYVYVPSQGFSYPMHYTVPFGSFVHPPY